MGVKKFKFVSPGVFIDEIDNSQLPGVAPPVGPVVIGRFERGPAMRPTMVNSFSEFVDVFGLPIPGGKGGDVWREGNYTAPTYAAYATQAWLRNSSPITVVRLNGHQHSQALPAGKAGWDTDHKIAGSGAGNGTDTEGGAYGLFVQNSGSMAGVTPGGTAASATITIDDAGQMLAGSTISVVTTAGDTVTITGHASAGNVMTDSAGESLLGTFDASTVAGGVSNNGAQATAIAETLDKHDDLTATAAAAIVTITQDTKGQTGNTAITTADESGGSNNGSDMAAATTIVNFVGGANSGNGTLAAVWYITTGSMAVVGLDPTDNSTELTGSGVLTTTSAEDKYEAIVYNGSGTEVERSKFSFDEDSEDYIRKVFNTNPTLTNSTITHADYLKNYWLGSTFEREYSEATVDAAGANGTYGIILGLANGTGADTLDGGDHKLGSAREGQTGWFISQDLTTNKTAYYAYNMQKLFKFFALDDAEWAQRSVKISIQDIKVSTNSAYPYGTFSVVVRSISDSDKAVKVIERYSNCELNPNSPNYVARKIGDKYVVWDDGEGRYREYGNYENMSRYIRVEMNTEVEAAASDARYLPFGVFGPPKFSGFNLLSGSNSPGKFGVATSADDDDVFVLGNPNVARFKSDTFADRLVNFAYFGGMGAQGVTTASFSFPGPRLRISASHGNLSSPKSAYFGVDTSVYSSTRASTRYENSMSDLLRALPGGGSVGGYTATTGSGLTHTAGTIKTEYAYVFSLDDVGTGSVGDYNSAFYRSGLRKSGDSYTADAGNYKDVLNRGFNKFTTVLNGGYDGINIREKEPFRDGLTANGTPTTNSSFYSIKRAIDSVSDPEVVEMNLVVIPGITTPELTSHLIDICEERADALAIIDINGGYRPFTDPVNAGDTEETRTESTAVTTVVSNVETRGLNSSYAATYWPWIQLRDTINSAALWAPPSIAALGALAFGEKNAELWFAPAGFNRGGISDGAAGVPVIGVRQRLTSEERDKLYDANINPIASFPSEGIVIFGQKTLQVTASALDRINVRRLLIFLKKEISRSAARILFEQNVKATWTKFVNQVTPFLTSVKARLGLADYKLVLDETTTTPDLVDRNIVYAKIFLKPVKAIEFIALDFVITDQGASFED